LFPEDFNSFRKIPNKPYDRIKNEEKDENLNLSLFSFSSFILSEGGDGGFFS